MTRYNWFFELLCNYVSTGEKLQDTAIRAYTSIALHKLYTGLKNDPI